MNVFLNITYLVVNKFYYVDYRYEHWLLLSKAFGVLQQPNKIGLSKFWQKAKLNNSMSYINVSLYCSYHHVFCLIRGINITIGSLSSKP